MSPQHGPRSRRANTADVLQKAPDSNNRYQPTGRNLQAIRCPSSTRRIRPTLLTAIGDRAFCAYDAIDPHRTAKVCAGHVHTGDILHVEGRVGEVRTSEVCTADTFGPNSQVCFSKASGLIFLRFESGLV